MAWRRRRQLIRTVNIYEIHHRRRRDMVRNEPHISLQAPSGLVIVLTREWPIDNVYELSPLEVFASQKQTMRSVTNALESSSRPRHQHTLKFLTHCGLSTRACALPGRARAWQCRKDNRHHFRITAQIPGTRFWHSASPPEPPSQRLHSSIVAVGIFFGK